MMVAQAVSIRVVGMMRHASVLVLPMPMPGLLLLHARHLLAPRAHLRLGVRVPVHAGVAGLVGRHAQRLVRRRQVRRCSVCRVPSLAGRRHAVGGRIAAAILLWLTLSLALEVLHGRCPLGFRDSCSCSCCRLDRIVQPICIGIRPSTS